MGLFTDWLRDWSDPQRGMSDQEIREAEEGTAYDMGYFDKRAGSPGKPASFNLWEQRSKDKDLAPWWQLGKDDADNGQDPGTNIFGW